MEDQVSREEYIALRATIRERGTVRVITFLATIVAWAAIVLAFSATGPRDVVGSLVSLMVLAGGFEAVFQIHLGVERVGRYLQAFYEEVPAGAEANPPGERQRWETTAMVYGRKYRAAGSDPLFAIAFVLATFVNVLPVLRAWRVPAAFLAIAVPHLLFVVRVRVARHIAAGQRAEDLERFRELRAGADKL